MRWSTGGAVLTATCRLVRSARSIGQSGNGRVDLPMRKCRLVTHVYEARVDRDVRVTSYTVAGECYGPVRRGRSILLRTLISRNRSARGTETGVEFRWIQGSYHITRDSDGKVVFSITIPFIYLTVINLIESGITFQLR